MSDKSIGDHGKKENLSACGVAYCLKFNYRRPMWKDALGYIVSFFYLATHFDNVTQVEGVGSLQLLTRADTQMQNYLPQWNASISIITDFHFQELHTLKKV